LDPRPAHILVVEDEVRMAGVLQRGLREEGFAVTVVGTGEHGLAAVAREAPDAVVLDVMLPGLDGFEVCRRLRADGHWMPVLMLSARGAVDDRIRGLDSGADDYLTKPFPFGELLARVRAMLRRQQRSQTDALVAGDLRLEPASRRAWRGDVELSLSTREFDLLEAFLRRPGQVLTRGWLVEQAWDVAYEPRSNVVDVYVRYLRAKVDEPFGRASLETVRGAGYRLAADGGA
jgi:two-component system OmpR family response regulator